MTELFIRAKRLIKKAFVINSSIPKGYGTRSDDYEKYYQMKTKLICQAIRLIRKNSLPIKWGYKNGVTYFEFDRKQFSFHGKYAYGKKFNGEWCGFPRPKKDGLHCRGKGKLVTLVGRNNCY